MRPRPIVPGTTYMITRRTSQRQLLLRPSRAINGAIRYCIALAQRRSGLQIHAIVFLSNHYHIVCTDPIGTLPVFTEELNKLIARSLNCHHGRWENFWSGGDQTSHVRLDGDDAVLAKTVYTLSNPTAAGLVPHGTDWPGLRLFVSGRYRAKKPEFLFRKEEDGGRLPDKVELTLTQAPLSSGRLGVDVVKRAVSAREKQIRRQFRAEGRSFLGKSAVLRQRVTSISRRPAPRRRLSPSLACRDKWRRIEKLTQSKHFVTQHKACRLAFGRGEHDVCFPPGTYRFATQLGARVAEA